MLISELEAQLKVLREKHGDLPVLIEQIFTDDYPRMEVMRVSPELTNFSYAMPFEEYERMEDAGEVNSIVISDCPDGH